MTSRQIWMGGWMLLLVACQPPLLDEGSCQRDPECPGGFVCVQGRCARAALDAGRVDGAALDGQGLDAAMPDLAPLDSSEAPTDGASPDAVQPADAAPGDQPTLDVAADAAAIEDAALPDTPLVDAPVPDDAASPESGALQDAAEPTDVAAPVDLAAPADTPAPDDVAAAADTWVGEDSATLPDATPGPDHAHEDCPLVADGFVIADVPVVGLDSTIGVPVVKNPSFELSASEPLYWTPYGSPCTPSIHTPDVDSDVQALDGQNVYGCITGDPSYSGGLRQQVSGLTATVDYLLDVRVYLVAGCPTTAIVGRLGVDLDGGLDPNSANVVWTGWTGEDVNWQVLSLPFVATATLATVFLEYSMSSVGYSCSEVQETALFDLVTLNLK